MSKYSTNPIPAFKDAKLLIAALTEMGFKASEVQYFQTATQLFDFQGHATHYTDKNGDKGNIVLRASAVNRILSGGSSNDIGFKQNSDGSFSALISQYDSNFANAQWLGKLTGAYAREAIKAKALKQGFRFVGSTNQNGKTKLQFVQA